MAIRPRIPFPGPYKAHIIGTGSFLPEKTLTNEDLEKIVDTNDEWITSRTGIKVRHIPSDDETTATLAAAAAKRALEGAKLDPEIPLSKSWRVWKSKSPQFLGVVDDEEIVVGGQEETDSPLFI